MNFSLDPSESPGQRVARFAREVGSSGPMGAYLLRDRYVSFLDGIWDRGEQLSLVHTSCAVVAGGVLGYAGHPLRKPWIADGTWGITTWLNLDFGHPAWRRVSDPGPAIGVGDVFFRGDPQGSNGHVGLVTEVLSDGRMITLEGGGSWQGPPPSVLTPAQVKATSGTITRLSKPKNLFVPDSLGRVPVGWWCADRFVPTYDELLERLLEENRR